MSLLDAGLVTAAFSAITAVITRWRASIKSARDSGKHDEETAVEGFAKLARELREEMHRRDEDHAEERGRLKQALETLDRRVADCEEDRTRLHRDVTTLAARIEAILATMPSRDAATAARAAAEATPAAQYQGDRGERGHTGPRGAPGEDAPGGRRAYDPPVPPPE